MSTKQSLEVPDSFKVIQLYDSHVHWLSTGDLSLGLKLHDLKNLDQLRTLELKQDYFRGEWLYGVGWDENNFDTGFELTRDVLDSVFPNFPVIFSRVDGHSSCVNTQALKILNLLKDSSLSDIPRGIMREREHMIGILNLPPLSPAEIATRLEMAQEIFLRQGFTHIRDMASDLKLWESARNLEERGKLQLHVEFNFTCEDRADFERAFQEYLSVRSKGTKHLKPRGIKLYFDGSLGSGTALLRRETGIEPSTVATYEGLQLWSDEDILYVFQKTWLAGGEMAVHTLGDEAVDRIVRLSRQLYSDGCSGILNLEHVEVLRDDTLQKMKSLHVRCHLQPCHWLTDRAWLAEKLGGKLNEAFPWERLRANLVPMSFGSDSPIEPANLRSNLEALEKSAFEGIRSLKGDPLIYHQYPHPDGIFSTTSFNKDQAPQIDWSA